MPYKFTNPLPDYAYKSGRLFLGHDDEGREIGIETEIHAITVGGSGSGKGAGLLVQNARRWPESLVCIDPKGENARLSYEAREKMGQKIAVLDPFKIAKIPDRLRAGFNPLAAIDPASPFARAAISAIGNGLIVVHDPRHMEWVQGARALVAGIVAYVVANAAPEARTFATMRDILMQPDRYNDAKGNPILDTDGNEQGLYAEAQRMVTDLRFGGLIRSAGLTIMTAIESTKGMEKDYLGKARSETQWLDDENIAATFSTSTIDLKDLKKGNLSLFVVLPPDADIMATYAPFLRLAVKASLNVMSGEGAGNGKDCLFLLDEFYSIGKLDELSEAAPRMREYGVHLWPFLTNLGQMEELYGEKGSAAFFANADAHVFLGNDKDTQALAYISNRLGTLTTAEVAERPPIAKYVRTTYTPQNHVDAEVTEIRNREERTWFGTKKWKGFWEDDDHYNARINTEDENRRRHQEAENQNLRYRIVAEDENRKRHQTAEDENERRHNAVEELNAQNFYAHEMKKVGTPRLTNSEVATLIGKGNGDKLARSMIVFAKAGDVLNLQLAPFFRETERAPQKPLPTSIMEIIAAPKPAPVLRDSETAEIAKTKLRDSHYHVVTMQDIDKDIAHYQWLETVEWPEIKRKALTSGWLRKPDRGQARYAQQMIDLSRKEVDFLREMKAAVMAANLSYYIRESGSHRAFILPLAEFLLEYGTKVAEQQAYRQSLSTYTGAENSKYFGVDGLQIKSVRKNPA